MRIPRFVDLPFRYRVSVILTDSDKLLESSDGAWDVDTRRIYIRRDLSAARRRYILGHELLHAWVDWQHKFMDEKVMKN